MIKAKELVFKLDNEDGKIIWRGGFGYKIHDDFDYGNPPRQIFCLYVNGRIKNTFRNFSDAVTWAKQNFQILTENRIDKEHFRNLIKEAIKYGVSLKLPPPSCSDSGEIPTEHQASNAYIINKATEDFIAIQGGWQT